MLDENYLCPYRFASAAVVVVVGEPYGTSVLLVYLHEDPTRKGEVLQQKKVGPKKRYGVSSFCKALKAAPLGGARADGVLPKKVVLLNFPNNPTGYTVTEEEARGLVAGIKEAAETNRVVVILDDAYFGLVYDEEGDAPGSDPNQRVITESLFTRLVNLHPNVLAVKLDGPTKEDFAWGLRVGFMTFGSQLGSVKMDAFAAKASGLVRATISNASCMSQRILQMGYAHGEAYEEQRDKKRAILRERVKLIREILTVRQQRYSTSFEVMPFNSGYFMCLRPLGLEAVALRGNETAADQVREHLCNVSDEKQRAGVISLNGLIRLAFSSVGASALPALFENIHKAICAVQNGMGTRKPQESKPALTPPK